MANDRNQVIIKKVKKGGHGGHHGGAWKIAYADFVTAMMAFFLLMWLLNATTEEQKLGIADYFAPSIVTGSMKGADGVLGGNTITVDGRMKNDTSPVGISISVPRADEQWEGETIGVRATGTEEEEATEDPTQSANKGEEEENEGPETVDGLGEQSEEVRFEQAEQAIRQSLEATPELKELSQNLIIDQTPEGLRIQIVDKLGTAMFPSGSAGMYEHTRKLMQTVYGAIKDLDNKIAIKGHTDAKPFHSSNGYSNWELSTDRANASRRALTEAGMPPDRVESVVGRAAQDPLIPDDPYDPQNRRISIILLRDKPIVQLPTFENGE